MFTENDPELEINRLYRIPINDTSEIKIEWRKGFTLRIPKNVTKDAKFLSNTIRKTNSVSMNRKRF